MSKLSVVIPIYNEAKTILKILEAVDAVVLPTGMEKEIILVDDFSTDGTRDVLEGLEGRYKIFYQEKNTGKGAALRLGFSKASGDFTIVQDADLEYDPKEFSFLLEPLIDGRADVVYGSRFVGNRPHRVLFFWHYLGNKLLTLLSNMFTNINLTDMETCYKAFTREALNKILPRLSADRFNIEPDITAQIAKANLRVYEVGISYYGRTYEDGKKIGWKDGFSAIWAIIKYNLFQ